METKKDEIIDLAKKTKHYCDLLIEQSDNWLSEEEGIRNVERRIAEAERKNKRKKPSCSKGVWVILGILLSMSFISPALGQNIDSLYTLFSEAKNDERIRLANEISAFAYKREVINEEWTFSTDISEDFMLSRVLSCMSGFSSANANYKKALEYAGEGLEIALHNDDLTMIARGYNSLATIYDRLNQFDKSMLYFEKRLEAIRQTGDKEKEAGTLYSMGLSNLLKSRDSIGIGYIESALKIAIERDMKEIKAKCYGTIGEYHLKCDNTDAAMDAILKSLEACREVGTPFYLEAGLCRLGMAQMATGDYAEAEKNLLEALRMSGFLEDKLQTAFDLMALGDLMAAQGMAKKAECYYNQSIEKYIELQTHNMLSTIYDKLYMLHRDSNPLLSLEYLEKVVLIDDSLYNLEMHNQISAFQVRYDTQEKELEIVRQQAEIGIYKSNRIILIVSLSLSVLVLILLWWMLRLRNKRNRTLAEMNATKDKFFSIISHDLKNPAIAQRDALQQLMNNAGKWDAALLSQYYSELLKSADGQVELLYNLLNWVQVQTGRMPFTPIQFDLTTALRSDVTLIENMAKRKGIVTDIRIPDTAIVTGDSNMIATVVRNLLTNAVKFTPTDNVVSLRIEPSEGETYTVSVSDTGTGMSDEQQRNLFNLGDRRSRRGTSGETGSGLGLIVCKELIEKHGSALHVESEENKGSRFWFKLNFNISSK